MVGQRTLTPYVVVLAHHPQPIFKSFEIVGVLAYVGTNASQSTTDELYHLSGSRAKFPTVKKRQYNISCI